MYRFFSLSAQPARGVYSDPAWITIRNGLDHSLSTFVKYYERYPMAVSAQHFLMSIINFYGKGYNESYDMWYRYLIETSSDLSMALKMTSPVSVGQVFPGTFYGSGISEVLVSVTEPFDVKDAVVNWQRLEPVRVLSHPRSDTTLNVLNGFNPTDATGYAVIAIDIPLLMIQYRAFRQWESSWRISEDVQYSPMQFIHMYVLPKMAYSHLEYALFNRFAAKVLGASVTKESIKRPFYLMDWNNRIDPIQTSQVEMMSERTLNVSEMLHYLRAVRSPSQYEAMKLPNMLGTRQVGWALALSRLKVIEVLLTLDVRQNGQANGQFRNQIKRSIQSYKSDRSISNVLRRDHATAVQEQIDRILALT